MENIKTHESNLFSRNIVELKLISDRIAEGKGEKAGIFSNTYQILYILTRKDRVTPKELIAELNMAKSNLAILAKKMIKDGLMESHKDKSNKREIFYNITEDGNIDALVIETNKNFFSLNRENDIEVKWKEITKIGEDVILVKMESI